MAQFTCKHVSCDHVVVWLFEYETDPSDAIFWIFWIFLLKWSERLINKNDLTINSGILFEFQENQTKIQLQKMLNHVSLTTGKAECFPGSHGRSGNGAYSTYEDWRWCCYRRIWTLESGWQKKPPFRRLDQGKSVVFIYLNPWWIW